MAIGYPVESIIETSEVTGTRVLCSIMDNVEGHVVVLIIMKNNS